jgi:hypothetical protein
MSDKQSKDLMHIEVPRRLDSGQVVDEWMYEPFVETEDGYLKGRAVVTNIGIFPYLIGGEIENRLRLPEDVFDPASLDSLKMVPLTNDHPSEIVDASTIKDYQVGHLGSNIRTNGYAISADIVITDPETIALVKDGKVALSCGYFSAIEDVSGVKFGQPFDSKQTGIRYNHVAIVDAGRAGEDAVMFADNAESFACGLKKDQTEKPQDKPELDNNNDNKEIDMSYRKIMLDNKEVEVQESAADEILAIAKDRDSLEADKSVLETEKTKLEAQVDVLEEEKKQLEKDNKELEESIDGLVADKVTERVEVLAAASKAEVEVSNEDSVLDIKKKVILSKVEDSEELSAKLEDKGEVYVDARFDAVIESMEDAEEVEAENAEIVLGEDSEEEDGKSLSADSAKKKYLESFNKK